MIQIDDSGSGSLIGGTGIGILNTDTNEYYFDIIPLKYYQTELYQKKLYQDYVIEIVKKGFSKLNVTKKDTIQVCQSYVFDKLRHWLTDNEYNWSNAKIEGPLQYKVEESFTHYVINLGLPRDFVKHARFAFGFHRLLKWVFADKEKRKNLCKTQWKSWQKWGNKERSIYKNILTYPDYCLKCGKKIKPPQKVITIEYTTIKPATINLHPQCYSGELREFPPEFLREFSTIIKLRNLPENNEPQLFLKVLNNEVVVTSVQGEILGILDKPLSYNIAFWLNKGFVWQCYLKELSENQAKLNLKLIN